MGKGLLGPNGRSGGTIEGRFGEHYGGNSGIGGSKFGVGEGKVKSMGGIRGEVGGVENNSSMGSRLMTRGDVSLDGWVGAREGEVKDGGVDLEVGVDEVRGLLKQHSLTLILAVLFKLALFSLSIMRENDKNEVTNHFLL
ncbi:hypothetical protein Tco_0397660 [Tanacetum coccineum]